MIKIFRCDSKPKYDKDRLFSKLNITIGNSCSKISKLISSDGYYDCIDDSVLLQGDINKYLMV